MSTEEELLQQICEDPTDIETRLVYADCLSEKGDPRGAFIAQHCELDRMTGLEDRYVELAASTRRLEHAHAPTWLAEYLELADVKTAGWGRTPLDAVFNAEFRHGFLYRIAMTEKDIAAHWRWLREREPLQGVELRVTEYVDRAYGGLKEPNAFRALKVTPDGWFTDNSVGDALRWGLPNLRELDLSGCDMGLDGAKLLTNVETEMHEHFEDWTHPPPLPEGQLERLVLHGCGLMDEPTRLLFDAATTRELQQLVISQCRLVERATLEALAASPLSKLRHLSIAGNSELGGQLDALSGWSVLEQLESLAVPKSATPADLKALFPSPSAALRALDLSSAKALCAEPQTVASAATTLTKLDIGTARIGDAGWEALLAEASIGTCHELLANGCSLSDKAIDALAASPLDRLLTLDVSSNKLTDKGLAALADWPGLKHLTFLRVGNNRKVKAPGYQALIDSPHFDPAVLDIGKAVDEATTGALRERFGDALRVRS